MDPIGALLAVAAAFAPVILYLVRSPHRPDTQEILMLSVGWLLAMMALAFIARWFMPGVVGYVLIGIAWVVASWYAWSQAEKERAEKSSKESSEHAPNR